MSRPGFRRRLALLVGGLALLVVLAGCFAPLGGDTSDPEEDQLGWENGVWYDEALSITPGDGLNESEREAVVARAMARLERLRSLEFEESVPVSVISRSQYLANRSGGSGNYTTHERWNDQVWEGLFLVGEDARFSAVMNSTLGSSVLGYYSPSRGAIVVVSDSATPTLSRGTLVHELVHALQDQQFGLNDSADTQDEQLAADGLIEGEANLLQRRYEQRCGSGWDCPRLDVATGGGGGGGTTADTVASPYRRGVFTVIYQPYATGPNFVAALEQRGGWPAVNAAYDDYPVSTEQVLHPERYPDDRPRNVTVPDRSGDDWDRFDVDPVADTVGEASIYAMLATNGVAGGGTTLYSYQSAASEGWAGDALVPYHSGDETGYVWRTAWDSPGDAEEFLTAYRSLLASRNATDRGGGVYTLPASDPFGDAFSVRRDGATVTVVNGPTVADLAAIHPPA
jgi:hypothetical protein